MTQVVRICKYGCNRQLGEFSTKENKYVEIDGTLHTRERCESLKSIAPKNESHNEISLEIVIRKLESVGITLDLNKLRNATNRELN